MKKIDINNRDYNILFGTKSLAVGDALVHFEHGLARYDGQEAVTFDGVEQTLTRFVYRNGGKLLLPATEGKDFWQYGAPASTITLDRLKSDDWKHSRDEMITELKDSTAHLIATNEQRLKQRAVKITKSEAKYNVFEQSFPFNETIDQTRAIKAILDDIRSTEPMDRLLVGDVGFGKTEVALRALVAAVSCNKQVVVAAPTTILVRQHIESMEKRLAKINVRVAELSRLTSDADKAQLIKDVASGHVQVVIGTQALCCNSIKYKNLALVIIDEEQKFGAQQKLELRQLVKGLHVLSMTATPIPRSLAAVEIGLMKVSVVATPPEHRIPVETVVKARKFRNIVTAIMTEKARGGQCYLVCPRVSNVVRLAAKLKKLTNKFTIQVAHGQMQDDEMSAAISKFMNNKVDVLLSTTIVESGLDNERANTMIVYKADLFGLSQLHQLRGRVGRSNVAAHMVLLSSVGQDETSAASHRLSTFSNMSDLGAGFDVAREDRNFRGFGELDGDAQSGQMSKLGIGLYRHILTQ